MNSNQAIRRQTTSQLIDAITRDQFMLYGQPIVAVGHTRGPSSYVEILIRYEEEEKKSLPPGGFIDVLENLNLMSMLDRWVINRVVRSLADHHASQKAVDVPRYSVNLSVDSLYETEFCALMREHFHGNRLPRGKLWLEIDESDAQVHAVELAKLTSNLRPLGCHFALTSYTGDCLTPPTIKDLGVDAVKIDGQLISEIHRNVRACAKVRAIHGMCKKLGIRTIAEMVERPETLQKLEKLGIDYAQGAAIGAPVPLRSLGSALH